MSEKRNGTVAVWLSSHGNEKLIAEELKKINPKGIIFHDAHPRAAKLGVRFIGDGQQIMACYPGNPHGNPQEQAADTNLKWRDHNNPSIIFDIHESKTPGYNYTEVGKQAAKATIAGGIMLDRKKIIVAKSSSFYRHVPNAAAIETSIVDTDPAEAAHQLAIRLEDVARNVDSLEGKYDASIDDPEVTFYQSREIPTTLPDGSLAPWVSQLEEIPSASGFTELLQPIPDGLRRQLHIPVGIPLYCGYWGYNNFSREAPSLGRTKDGVVRRQWMANVLWEIAPPVEISKGDVEFKEESKSQAEFPPGVLQLAS